MKRINFDLELAKSISNGTKEGKIVTRDDKDARIICWDRNDETYPIVALIMDMGGVENADFFTNNGCYYTGAQNKSDLMLEVPEYTLFKDKDIVVDDEFHSISMIMNDIEIDYNHILTHYYVGLNDGNLNFYEERTRKILNATRFATEEERQQLIEALKQSTDSRSKECLKMLGIDEKSKYEFTFRQLVLVRDDEDIKWEVAEFAYIDNDDFLKYCTIGGSAWKYCIPYEGNEHLLGTI